MKVVRVLSVWFLMVLIGGAADTREALQARLKGKEEPRILFVGNSYSFQVPRVLAELVRTPNRKLIVEQVTKGGWTLQKHAASQKTLEKIREGDWDVVVLQEQSQLPSFARPQRERQMIPPARSLAEEIRKVGAIPVFFQTWGRRDGDRKNSKAFPGDTFEKMQARLATGYREAAQAAGGALVVPVGEAWAREIKRGQGARLFSRDGSHPSAAGVQLSAQEFRRFFFGD